MTNSEIYYLAGKCLVIDENPTFRNEFIELCKGGLIDWLKFVETCSNNLVLPLIFLKFRSQGVLDYIPIELRDHLFDIYTGNCNRNNEILRQVKSVTAILNKNNIFPLYLKGAGNLIDDVYSDIGERMMGDIDLMVPEEDYLTTADIMLNAGYKSYVDISKVDVNNISHYPPLNHPDFVCDIEIHRIPTGYTCSGWFNQDIINAERRNVTSCNSCYVESPSHQIIHNFIHGQLAHKGHILGQMPLRDIYDLYLFSKKQSLLDTLPKIQTKNKAIAYFAFTRTAFDLNKKFFPLQNRSYKLLKKRHDLNLNWPWFGRVSSRFLESILVKIFYSKETRLYIARRLRSRQFYKNQFERF